MPLQYKPLPLGKITPRGWLREQLVTMANGLSGHLDLFWEDVKDSVWVGGKHDHSGAGHERGPYWLNGVVPLSAYLNATGDSTSGALNVDLNEQVNRWVTTILDAQLPSGWLGPDDGFGGKGNTYWSAWNIVHSLLQYADAHEGEPIGDACYAAVLAHVKEAYRRQQATPFTAWSQNRWQDWVFLVQWLWDKAPQTCQFAVRTEHIYNSIYIYLDTDHPCFARVRFLLCDVTPKGVLRLAECYASATREGL